jgi:hypothetical protein
VRAGVVHRNFLAIRKFAPGLRGRAGKLGFCWNCAARKRHEKNAEKQTGFSQVFHSASISRGSYVFYAALVNASSFTIHFFDASENDC